MPGKMRSVQVNRAPVLTLWAAVVAERLGYGRATALTLGRAVAGLNAQSKARRLGMLKEPEPGAMEPAKTPTARASVELMGRAVPVINTPRGLRAAEGDHGMQPDGVERYLGQKFGEALDEVRSAMHELADSYPPEALAERAYSLYERFRPRIPEGTKGWGASGTLDLELIRSLARRTASK